MTIRVSIVSIVVLGATVALAQAPLPQTSPHEMVLGRRLLIEINDGIKCGADLITVQRTLDQANARVRELEAKYESKPGLEPK